MKKILFSLLFLLVAINSIAQTSYNMPVNGYLEIHSDSGIIYDDGGVAGNYSTRVSSVVTIYPATEGGYVRLTGQYSLEDIYKSKVLFFNGDTNSYHQICSISNDGCIDIRSDAGPLTIRFFVDTETPNSGFEFNIHVCSDLPTNINTLNITDSNAEISWGENDTSAFWIFEYSSSFFSIGNGTKIFLDTNFVNLNNLSGCTHYYYYVYSACDTIGENCNNRYGYTINGFYTESPNSNVPTEIDIQSSCNEITISWVENDTNTVWFVSLSNGETIYTDVPNCIFDSLSSGEYYHLTIRDSNVASSQCDYSIGVSTKCCCPKASNLSISSILANEAMIVWDADTSATGWIVMYSSSNGSVTDRIIVDTNFVLLTNLLPVRPYEVIVHSLCDGMSYKCSNRISFMTAPSAIDNCLSFTDFNSPNFSSSLGSFSNPFQSHGLVDYGYQSSSSRHTIHYDTSEVDLRTGGVLQTIPLGEEASIRLGNWLSGAEAESCTYMYYVDTNDYDMFLLKYAVVLEDPNHLQEQQPRFTLEILDSNFALVSNQCGYTNFYASGDLDWNSVSGTNIIWKDWTSLGIDISKYHNQNIYIRFTTYDCDEGGHFGYAYYNIKCGNKYLNKSSCGHVDSLLFEAPLGFDYLWYNANQPDDTISKENQLTVPVDNNTYYCRCSYKENSDCNFIISFEAERQFPFPSFDYSLDTCGYKINFSNQSVISKSDTIAIEIEKCNDVKWIFHDGTTSNLQNPSFNYDTSGIYPIILIASMNEGDCTDTLFADIVVDNSGFHKIEFMGDTVICRGSQTQISINEFDSYKWSNNEITNSVLLSPTETSVYFVEAYEKGCLRKDSIRIHVLPYHSNDTIEAVICNGSLYSSNGFNESEEGFYTKTYTAFNGCDSILNLDLKVVDKIEDYSLIENKYIVAYNMPILINASCDYCYNYFWNTGSQDSVILVNYYGRYYVKMQNACGVIYDSVLIVKPDVNLFVPNAFTPDSYNNNTFFPVFSDDMFIFIQSFEIYNRNGERIYFSKDKPWDGKYKNKKCSSGAYVWRLRYRTLYSDSNIFEKSGIVNLIR